MARRKKTRRVEYLPPDDFADLYTPDQWAELYGRIRQQWKQHRPALLELLERAKDICNDTDNPEATAGDAPPDWPPVERLGPPPNFADRQRIWPTSDGRD